MTKKEQAEKVLKIIKDYKSSNNKDLIFALDFIKEDFEETKSNLLRMTNHLDKLENTYNLILKEYEERTKTNE
jgi:prefoldin subunit 5